LRKHDEVLEPIVRPITAAVSNGFISMKNNDSSPTTGGTNVNLLEEEGIDIMECPTGSPDFNPSRIV